MNPTFDLVSGIPLGYAMVSAVAEQNDLRLLVIKGLQLSEQGLRSAAGTTDVDVLLAPDQTEAFIAAVEARGWSRAEVRDVPGVLPQHAVTLVHPGWPCALDVHRYYPGFFAPPDEVFAALWELRCQQTFAGASVWGLSPEANAVFIALHHERHARSGRHRRQYAETLAVDFSPEQIRVIDALTRRGRCAEVLGDLRARLGLAALQDLTAAERGRWRYYQLTHETGSTGAWLSVLLQTPWAQRPAVLARALWPSAAEVRAEYAFHGQRDVTGYRLRRLLRGARALPEAVRALPAALRSRRRLSAEAHEGQEP